MKFWTGASEERAAGAGAATSSVEILSSIRLNLASVKQFAAIASSLADDNPPIRRPIHEAAREVRAASQLIDHLRSLFNHQQAIELERQQQVAPFPFGPASGPTQLEQDDNLQYFTYANQQTLARAAKCLVANVAKILYLTDQMVLGSGPAGESPPGRPGRDAEQQLQGAAQRRQPLAGAKLEQVSGLAGRRPSARSF